MQEKIIGIGGGVGPMAGVELHRKVIENTAPGGTDQGHLEVYHLSRSSDIGDRTEFLLGKIKENPAEGMFRTVQVIAKAATLVNKQVVIGVPCNTFHAPAIFNHFLALIKENNSNIQVVNMLEETGNFINKSFPKVKKIGLLSTTGTRKVQVYKRVLEPLGFDIIEVPIQTQEEVHDSIYNNKWGIKALTPVSTKARNNFLKFSKTLKEKGAEVIILGCTEIPLALPEESYDGIQLIDPVFVLSRALVQAAAKEKLQ